MAKANPVAMPEESPASQPAPDMVGPPAPAVDPRDALIAEMKARMDAMEAALKAVPKVHTTSDPAAAPKARTFKLDDGVTVREDK